MFLGYAKAPMLWNLFAFALVGVHCGNAISGMLNKKQRHLSFLGEAVSTAAAIQAVGQPDAIHLTGEVLAESSLGAAMFSPLAGCFIDGVGIMNTCFLKVRIPT